MRLSIPHRLVKRKREKPQSYVLFQSIFHKFLKIDINVKFTIEILWYFLETYGGIFLDINENSCDLLFSRKKSTSTKPSPKLTPFPKL
jgi:hypothetical protein